MALICDICKTRPAATRISFAVNGQPKVLDVCTEDFARFQQGAEEMLAMLQQEHVGKLPAESYTKVLAKQSADVAAEFGQRQVASEHILVALMKDKQAQTLLSYLHLNPQDIQGYISMNALRDARHSESVELSRDAQHIFTEAYETADRHGSDQPGPAHLLLALTHDRGMAGTLLRRFGVTSEQLTEVIEQETPTEEEESTPTLNEYSRDLTLLARQKELDPLIGREKELESVIEVLSRRRKNNPVLIGEPGVGKTAVVEGLAQRIVAKQVPPHLYGKRVVELSLTSILAGARYRGEFEERLQNVLEEITENKNNLIVFIDELHTVVGAGATEGSLDAANIIKPALARGDLHLIGATTRNEYQKYVEKDSALERRFQPVPVSEPTPGEAEAIIQGISPHYESHHGVVFTKDAIQAAVQLSDRYITHRHLPDKAIDLLDQAASKIRIAAPVGGKVKPEVTVKDIAAVLAQLTGLPVSQINQEDKKRLINLEERLHQRIIGQEHAVKAVANAVRMSYAGLTERNKPIATLFFMGPTGVGKTELAKALAAEVFGNESALIRIDMSEYMERHAVARLIGSPPGYVGYEEGGQLTEAVRRTPYSVILLDEIEKAHHDVANILLQLFDDGRLTDGKGRIVDFSNTIIIATSNIGTSSSVQNKIGFQASETQSVEEREKSLEQLHAHFRPELVNRLDEIIVFTALTPSEVQAIVGLELAKVVKRADERGIALKISSTVQKHFAAVGFSEQFGARELRRRIKQELEHPLAARLIEEGPASKKKVTVSIKNGILDFK